MPKDMIDYLSDADGDLMISGGDWVRGENTYGHQRSILEAAPGDYKATPLVGVGITLKQDDEDSGGIRRTIAQQFMADGMTVNDLTPNTESITDSTVRVFDNSYYE
jgi:hypothetical protein